MVTCLNLILRLLEGLSTLLSAPWLVAVHSFGWPSTWPWSEAVFEMEVGFGRPLDRTILSSTSSWQPIMFHNELKPIKCNMCNYSFFYRSNLKNHMISLFAGLIGFNKSTLSSIWWLSLKVIWFRSFRSTLSGQLMERKTCCWLFVQIFDVSFGVSRPTKKPLASRLVSDPLCKIECSMLTVCTSEGSIVTPYCQQVTNTPPGGNKRLGPNFCLPSPLYPCLSSLTPSQPIVRPMLPWSTTSTIVNHK